MFSVRAICRPQQERTRLWATSHWQCRRSTSTRPGARCLESSYTRRLRGWHRALGPRPPAGCAASTVSRSTRACPTFFSPAVGRHSRHRRTQPQQQQWRSWLPVRRRAGQTALEVTASTRGRRVSTATVSRTPILPREVARWPMWPWRTEEAAAADRWYPTPSCSGRHAGTLLEPRHHEPLPWITASRWTQARQRATKWRGRDVDERTRPVVQRRHSSVIVVVRMAASNDKANVTSRAVWHRWRPSTKNRRRRRRLRA